jgi:hypothetical protein
MCINIMSRGKIIWQALNYYVGDLVQCISMPRIAVASAISLLDLLDLAQHFLLRRRRQVEYFFTDGLKDAHLWQSLLWKSTGDNEFDGSLISRSVKL